MGPGSAKHNKSSMSFKQMENITNFLSACEKYGLAKSDLFQTVDLYEKQNMWQVVLCLFALGRKVFSCTANLDRQYDNDSRKLYKYVCITTYRTRH